MEKEVNRNNDDAFAEQTTMKTFVLTFLISLAVLCSATNLRRLDGPGHTPGECDDCSYYCHPEFTRHCQCWRAVQDPDSGYLDVTCFCNHDDETECLSIIEGTQDKKLCKGQRDMCVTANAAAGQWYDCVWSAPEEDCREWSFNP